jgi:hypothetical protein
MGRFRPTASRHVAWPSCKTSPWHGHGSAHKARSLHVHVAGAARWHARCRQGGGRMTVWSSSEARPRHGWGTGQSEREWSSLERRDTGDGATTVFPFGSSTPVVLIGADVAREHEVGMVEAPGKLVAMGAHWWGGVTWRRWLDPARWWKLKIRCGGWCSSLDRRSTGWGWGGVRCEPYVRGLARGESGTVAATIAL